VEVSDGAVSSDDPFAPRELSGALAVSARRHDLSPASTAVVVTLTCWAVLTASLVGIGLALSAWAFDGSVGAWDRHVVDWFVLRRGPLGDVVSEWGSRLSDTITIIAGTGIVAVVLLVRRRWPSALFVVLAPSIEVTAFLVVTFVVDRERPAVPQLDVAPPTSSFPSGHVAAAVAFYVASALVLVWHHRSTVVRCLALVVAVVVPVVVLLSRLYRGMHHPSDVIVGYGAGLVCIALALLVVRATVAAAMTDPPAQVATTPSTSRGAIEW
jgi:undecaprenyl-diphosphatase